jgi:shikimate dehydrogenase
VQPLNGTGPVRLWLIGSGISASPSPAMQEAALRALAMQGSYTIVDAVPADLPGLLRRMRAGEVRGANVTLPYKGALAAACDRLEGDAAICGVVNTITVEDGELVGDTTDAQGFELGLSAQRLWPARDARAVVVGAGGAAASVILALGRAPAGSVLVTSRRPEQAAGLAERLAPHAPVRAAAWESAELAAGLAAADIVVNAASAGLEAMPFSVDDLAPDCVVSDLRYRPRPVDLVAAAQSSGRPAADGLEMLLYQGMLSLQRWTGAEPPWPVARAALFEAVGA